MRARDRFPATAWTSGRLDFLTAQRMFTSCALLGHSSTTPKTANGSDPHLRPSRRFAGISGVFDWAAISNMTSICSQTGNCSVNGGTPGKSQDGTEPFFVAATAGASVWGLTGPESYQWRRNDRNLRRKRAGRGQTKLCQRHRERNGVRNPIGAAASVHQAAATVGELRLIRFHLHLSPLDTSMLMSVLIRKIVSSRRFQGLRS